MTVHRTFSRRIDAIQEIFAFTAEVFAREGVDSGLLPSVDLTLEELFTNMVKYSPSSSTTVRIDVTKVDGGVEVTLTDYDVEPFDVTRSPDVNVNLPIEQRKPGGLGLHLIRRLVDSVEYAYSTPSRQSRITFRKTRAGSAVAGGGTSTEGANARD